MYKINSQRLKNWFLNEKRDLPWRNRPSPYAVWVSEVMLQQTQVAVVIPYFERWMLRFPDIPALAHAKLDEVIKCWEGLGYYSRARNLHEGARYILENFEGKIPSDEQDLRKIKGLGPYTVAAILSFAFHQKTAAVDGNVLRVLARYFHIEDDIAKTKTLNRIREIAHQILPDDESWIQNEALIEIGATVCKKKPECIICPLRSNCAAYAKGSTGRLPFKSSKNETVYLYRSVPIILCKSKLLVKRNRKGQVMSDLHEFPYFETNVKGWNSKKLMKELHQTWSLNVEFMRELPITYHSYTKYQVRLNPVLLRGSENEPIEGHAWHSFEELRQLAFSSGHKRIFSSLEENE